MEHLLPAHSRRASPSGKPPPPPRITRAHTMALQNKTTELVGLQLVAALDESYPPPTNLVSPFSSVRRARSDSTMSSDTFDGIYSLGDGVDDVDMVADDELSELDVDVDDVGDVFRPGALVDRRLDEVFGGTRTSDLERMLLASAVADDDLDEEDTAAVIAHLAHLDSMQLAQEKAQKKTEKGGFCVLKPAGQDAAVLVVAAAAVVDAAGSRQHLEIAAALPPKYVADQRCRAHKRTFGERTTSFNFRFPTVQGAAEPLETATSTVAVGKKAGVKRGRSLFQEAAEDIACRDVDREQIKENLPPVQAPVSEKVLESVEKVGSETTESKSESVEKESTVQQLQPQTPVRPISKITTDAFQTPLRRSVTAPVASTRQQDAFQTPISASTSAVSETPTAGVTVASTMSPAPSFDKVAVVHAKDTPGRVDKFEWTIRPREAIRSKTVLFSTQPSTPQAEQLAEPLPPRYLGDGSESPQKRRIHSTTFGTFARSFSFTATAGD